jgi:hypothetical protein
MGLDKKKKTTKLSEQSGTKDYLVGPFNLEAIENTATCPVTLKSLHQDVGPRRVRYEPSSFVTSNCQMDFS